MCNSEKLGKSFLINITSLDKIDYVISDDVFDKNLVKKFKNTKFITAT
jgi:DeoR/GlpR family transcriptional regulator of sugar metabolism